MIRAVAGGASQSSRRRNLGDAILGFLPSELREALVWPTPPATTSEVTVTTLAEFNAAALVNGARITVDGAISGAAVIDADDVAVVGLPGASFVALDISRNRHRILVEDISATSIAFRIPGAFDPEVGGPVYSAELLATDVAFRNVTVDNPAESAIHIFGRRVSILDSSLKANWYSVYVGTVGDFFNEDIIVHNCTMDSAGPEATVRLLKTARSVVTSCRLKNGNKHNWRLHEGSTMGYCARNTFVNAGIMLTDPFNPEDTIGTFWFTDNLVSYSLANGVISTLSPYTRIEGGTISDNIFEVDAGVATSFSDLWDYGAVPAEGWDLSGNVVLLPAPVGVTGFATQAAFLDAVDDTGDWPVGSNEFSFGFSFGFREPLGGSQAMPIRCGTYPTAGYSVQYFHGTGRFVFSVGDKFAYTPTGGCPYVPGNQHTVLVTLSGGVATFYLDGVAVQTLVDVTYVAPTGYPFSVGASNATPAASTVVCTHLGIQQVQVANAHALTQGEVTAWHDAWADREIEAIPQATHHWVANDLATDADDVVTDAVWTDRLATFELPKVGTDPLSISRL